MNSAGEFGERGFRPVISEALEVTVIEVVECRFGKEGEGQMEANTEAAGIHRGFKQGPGSWAAVLIGAQEFGGASEVLCDPSAVGGPGEGLRQQLVSVHRELSGSRQRRGVENLGHGQRSSSQQLPHTAVRISAAGCRKGGVLPCVFGPERAEHKGRPSLRIGEEGVDRGGDLLAHPRVS
ncbi:hypothetical protein AQJ27_44030 [Streptomyces olivochromogenes]|nr:hypothetical protein AQJ27_44030 [Streptomyces olivochromogenes]